MARLSRRFSLMSAPKCSPTTPQQHATAVWALPFSLATTWGIIIIFFSSRYLDVSVPWVGSLLLEWYTFSVPGCPIRKSSDISLVCSSPKLIAAYHVLHRLLESRHPPYALNCFKKITKSTCNPPSSLTDDIIATGLPAVSIFLYRKIWQQSLIIVITRHYNFYFPICQRTYLLSIASLSKATLTVDDVLESNQVASPYIYICNRTTPLLNH